MIRKNYIPNQEGDEKIMLHLRKHWFIFFRLYFFFAILAAIPAVIIFVLALNNPVLFSSDKMQVILKVGIDIYYLMILVFALTIWTINYLDVWTITSRKIISRDQLGLFNRVVSELELNRIQDITAEQKGILETTLNYGDVQIQSAGEIERFTFTDIPNPNEVARMIEKIRQDCQHEQPENTNQPV